MDEHAAPSDAERELRDLRARAFGPNADIMDDPIALARLDELERAAAAARAPAVVTSESAPSEGPADAVPAAGARPVPEPEQESAPIAATGSGASIWRRATTTTTGHLLLVAAGAVAAVSIVYGVISSFGPRPDATMHPIAAEPDSQVARHLAILFLQQPDPSSLRAYGAYRGIEIWSGLDAWGSPCLYGYERSIEAVVIAECTPREGELVGDIGDWPTPWEFEGLAKGSVIRFHLSGDSVDVHVYPAAEGD